MDWKRGSGYRHVARESILLMRIYNVFTLHWALGLCLSPPSFVHQTRPNISVFMSLVFLLLSPRLIYFDFMSLSSSDTVLLNQFIYKYWSNLVALNLNNCLGNFKKILAREAEGWGKEEMLVKWYKLSVRRWIPSGDRMHNIVTIVNNNVLYTWILLKE